MQFWRVTLVFLPVVVSLVITTTVAGQSPTAPPSPPPAPTLPAGGSLQPPASVTVQGVLTLPPDGIPRGPGQAVVSWKPLQAAVTVQYTIERATFRDPSASRSYVPVGTVSVAVDGRPSTATYREPLPLGFGVCYRVLSQAEGAVSAPSSEACLPIPPTSGAPQPPDAGSGQLGVGDGSRFAHRLAALWLALGGAAAGAFTFGPAVLRRARRA